jgi:hypothetical protein
VNNVTQRSFKLPILIALLSLIGTIQHGYADDPIAPKKMVVQAKLTHVQEVRKAVLASMKDDDTTFDFNKARLELSFHVTSPKGKQFVDLEQPKAIQASDSTGKNLADVKPTFMNHTEYVKMIHTWGKPSEEVTLTLAPPARKAKQFSVSADFDMWAFDELKDEKFIVNSKSTPIDGTPFGNTKISAYVQGDDKTVRLVFQPGSIKRSIESVELFDGSTTHKTNGSMWNEQMLTYMFNTSLKPTFEVRAKVRSGLDTYSCQIKINNHELP